ncbi:MAG: DUF2335 domain-containing protein [Mycobacteriales bacterium]
MTPNEAVESDDSQSSFATASSILPPGQSDSGSIRHTRNSIFQRQLIHVGPLPKPEVLAAYESAHPGLAERIVASMEREQAHRHSLDRAEMGNSTKVVDAHVYHARMGVWIGPALVLAGFALAAILAVSSHPVPATVVGGLEIGFVGVVAAIRDRIKRTARRVADTSPKA